MKKYLTQLALATLALIHAGVPCLATGPGANFGDELFKLTAPENQSLADSVAISGHTALVGSSGDSELGDYAGSLYVFDLTTGHQTSKLFASDAARHDFFGHSVAADGDKAIVGANGKRSAYLFDVLTGQELYKLTPSVEIGIFGYSVGISGNTAVVGAPIETFAASTYLFDVLTGQERFRLTPSDLYPHGANLFGHSVAVSGNTAIVGAPFDSQAGNRSGAAYLFDVTTGQELFKLTASGASGFGDSVAISGNIAIVGTLGSDAAYLFDATTGQELAKLTSADNLTGGYFGASVAISGNLALVADERNDGAGDSAGSAYLFDVTTHEQLIKIIASDAAAYQYFGEAVSISGSHALVGSAGANNFLGAAYVFSTVPEPATLALLALGLPLIVWRNSRRSGSGGAHGPMTVRTDPKKSSLANTNQT